MTPAQLRQEFHSTLGMFFHPRLRLLIARHVYGAINKPISVFSDSPSLGDKLIAIMNDLMTIEDIHRLLQVCAIKLKQEVAEIQLAKQDAPMAATALELQKGIEALMYLFEHQLPHPIRPATQLEIQQLKLAERLN